MERAHANRGDHPIRTLQRRAGNRAVTSLIEINLQRQKAPAAKKSADDAGPSAALLAWFDASIVGPINKAIATPKVGVAIKELQNAKRGVRVLGDAYAGSERTFGAYIDFMHALSAFQQEMKPDMKTIEGRMETVLLGSHANLLKKYNLYDTPELDQEILFGSRK